jgi:hypothetical protein
LKWSGVDDKITTSFVFAKLGNLCLCLLYLDLYYVANAITLISWTV